MPWRLRELARTRPEIDAPTMIVVKLSAAIEGMSESISAKIIWLIQWNPACLIISAKGSYRFKIALFEGLFKIGPG